MAKVYETIISVLDRLSAPVLGMEEKLAKLGNVGSATQKKLKMSPHEKLWNELTEHVAGAREAFGSLGEHIGEMGERLADVLPMLGGLGGAASVAGLLEIAHATAEAAEALHNVSLITGVAVPQLQALDFAASHAGVSSDSLGRALEKLNVNIGKAAEGQNKQGLALFHAMGITLRDTNGHVKSAAELLPQLEASFEKTKDPALRAAMAIQLFGRGGEDILPFLTQGPDAIAKLQAEFNKFGYRFSDEDQEGLEQFNDAWKDTTLSVQGLKDEIGAKLAPVLTPLLEDFADLVSKNRDWIALDMAGAVKSLGEYLDKIDWKGDAEAVQNFAVEADHLMDKIGGLTTVLIAGGVIITASFLQPVIELSAAFVKLGISMATAVLGPVVELGASFVALVPEIGGVRDAMAALDLAMDANPLGVLVIAAAAAGAVAYELYHHWDEVSKKLSGVWQYVDSEFNKVFGPIEKVLQKLDGELQSIENLGDHGGAQPGTPAAAAAHGGRFGGLATVFNRDTGNGGSGKVDVAVTFNNPPQGMVASAKSSGGASKPVMRTGSNGTIDNHRS